MRVAVMLAVVSVLAPQQQGKRPPQGEGIAAGREAANFKLKKLKRTAEEKEETVELASFKDKQPVVLIFGSYT